MTPSTQTTDSALSECSAGQPGAQRRAVLGGLVAAAGAVCAGCSTYGTRTSAPAPAQKADGPGGGASSTDAPAAAAPLAPTSAVPVGGGTILADKQIVLAQPTAGTFKAFTAVCTHQGCTVSSIDNGVIVCPCHGSRFHLADGSVDSGPAQRPLAPIAIKVADGQISLA